MIIPFVALSLCGDVVDIDPSGQWSICYTIEQEGPLYTYTGQANIHGSASSVPCLEYSIEIPPGDVIGYCYRWDQFEQVQVRYPMLPFDTWEQTSSSLTGVWCCPTTLEPWQSVPRHFKFSVQKTQFDADDLSEMLADWGVASAWDLDGSGVVDGPDITIMLAGWGPPS